MTKILVIRHDNGIKGQGGYTDYTAEEVEKKGGEETIINEYKNAGITVFEWEWYIF